MPTTTQLLATAAGTYAENVIVGGQTAQYTYNTANHSYRFQGNNATSGWQRRSLLMDALPNDAGVVITHTVKVTARAVGDAGNTSNIKNMTIFNGVIAYGATNFMNDGTYRIYSDIDVGGIPSVDHMNSAEIGFSSDSVNPNQADRPLIRDGDFEVTWDVSAGMLMPTFQSWVPALFAIQHLMGNCLALDHNKLFNYIKHNLGLKHTPCPALKQDVEFVLGQYLYMPSYYFL
jgi:hypothetical protein